MTTTDTDKIRAAADDVLDYLDGMNINNLLIANLRTALDTPAPTVNPAPVFLAVYIATTNDTNGNPRRGWYVSRIDGEPVIPDATTGRKGETAPYPAYTCWIEEGYGNFPWPEFARRLSLFGAESMTYFEARDAVRALVRETGRIEVTPGEYRSARKLPRFGK